MIFWRRAWRTAAVCAAAALSGLPASCWSAERPNVVLILADDMGYGDVHVLNERSRIPTPNLDALAAEGVTFTDAHTPSAVCTPTRYGLLTGRYCWRSRLKRGVLNGYSEPLIERDRLTVARLLQSVGYRTAVVGKWHLGLGFVRDGERIDYSRPVTHGPNDLGFDYSFIIPASLDFPPYVYLENGRVTQPPTINQAASPFPAFWRRGERAPDFEFAGCLDRLLGRAQAFIERSAAGDRPFFLYFALTAPHKPALPHPRFRGRTGLGPYGDLVHQVDWTVGQVLRTLADVGAADDTLVIYTSDNGSYMYRLDDPQARDHVDDPSIQAYRADRHTANYVFRGTKADIWEGGHRVPFFARWPGRIARGSRCEATICLTDVLATAAELSGAAVPAGQAEDSFSFLPLLEGRPRPARRPPVVHHSAAGMFAIRDGRWKLVLGDGSGGRESPRGEPFRRPYQLFDLQTDLGERRNVIAERPEVARRLEAACERIRLEGSPP